MLPLKTKRTKKALTPEKIVEADILAMCAELGLDVSVVDSKMTYSAGLKKYVESETESGFSDLCGNTPDGFGVFIELKAIGKIKTVTQKQKNFLIRKAEAGCFACAVDRPEVLFRLYLDWKRDGRAALLSHLEQL